MNNDTKQLSKKEQAAAIKKFNKKMAKKNAAFMRLPDEEKRVAIAKDVLKRLKKEEFFPISGSYIRLDPAVADAFIEKDDTQMQQIFMEQEKCSVCALGGMFVCAVRAANDLKVKDLTTPDINSLKQTDVLSYLGRFFSKDQLRLIEAAFECRTGNAPAQGWNDECRAANRFAFPDDRTHKVDDREERMRTIMKNIIKNDGEFVLPKRVMKAYRADRGL